jgi:hypothetical protein
LRSFIDGPAEEQDSWGILDDFTINDGCQLLSREITKLVFAGLTGVDTIYCWISRRIRPLQYRPNLMCEYSGIDDPQRYTKEELDPEEIEHRIRGIIKVGRDVEFKLGMPMFEKRQLPKGKLSSFPPSPAFLWFCTSYSLSCRSPPFLLQSLVQSSVIRDLRSLQMTKRSQPLPPPTNVKPLRRWKMLDPLTRSLWRKNLWQMCVVEFVALAGACEVLAKGLFPAIHHLPYADS